MCLTITQAVWLIGVHSIIHGIFGIFWINTSHYVNYKPELIHTFTTVHIALIVLGLSTFFILVCRRPLCVRFLAALLMILALVYFIVGIVYFATYLPFFANSIFDSFFHYNDIECWVGPDYPLAFWHVITFLMVLLIPLWFFYGFLLCRLAPCVCCLPCPPPACNKYNNDCPPVQRECCLTDKWYHRLFKSKTCQSSSGCCTATPAAPVCNLRNPSCTPCPRKNPKFVLTLRPGKVLCK